MRKILVRLLLFWPLWLLPVAAAFADSAPEIRNVRVTTVGEITRLILEIDRETAHTAGVTADGSKLLIDLPAAMWRLGSDRIEPEGVVTSMRYGRTPEGAARLVADVSDGTRIAGQRLLPADADAENWRLIIFLEGTPPTIVARRSPPLPLARPEPLDVAGTAKLDPALREAWQPVAARQSKVVAVAIAAPVRLPKARLPLIVLDPGHGGEDPGAIAVNGSYEKNIVLELAQATADLIERSGRYRVAMTRNDDVYVGLRQRIAEARALGGDLFISIHADSIAAPDRRGASIYTLSETASDDEAARLAAVENKADILAHADLSNHHAMVAGILLDLAQRDTLNRSIAFADMLAEEVSHVSPLLRRHRRFAGFAVLKSPDMPSVLLETGYLSNPDDVRNLIRPQFRAKLSAAILQALDRYFGRQDS